MQQIIKSGWLNEAWPRRENCQFALIKLTKTVFEFNIISDTFLNGTALLVKWKQLFEYQNFLLLNDIWWAKS